MSAPNVYFADESQPLGTNQKIQLHITSDLSMAQALAALSVFLHLRNDFDWRTIPKCIGKRELTFSGAIIMAKIMSIARDYTRLWNPHYPYCPPGYWKKTAPEDMRHIGCNRSRRWENAGLGPNLNSEGMPPG